MYMNLKEMTPNTFRLMLLLAAAATGMICGASSYSGDTAHEFAERLIEARRYAPAGSIILSSFRGTFILTAVCFLMGFSAVFQPAEAVVPFIFGTGFGYAAAAVFSAEKGLFCLLLMIPGAAAAAVAVAAAARESMRMSLAVFRRTFIPEKYCPADIGLYIRKFMIITAMAAGAAITDGICAVIYSIIGK